MLAGVEEALVNAFRKRDVDRDWVGTADDIRHRAEAVGAQSMLDRLATLAEGTDRRLGYLLTAGAFVVAFSGGGLKPHGSEISVQSIFIGWAGLLGAAVVLFALRGTMRRVDLPILVREVEDADVSRAHAAFERKRAWTWVASLALWPAAVLLAASAVIFALGGG